MIYAHPSSADPIDQGDLIDDCPLLTALHLDPATGHPLKAGVELHRITILTQTCDIANEKVTTANVAQVFDAQKLVEQGMLKASDVRGPVRAGRVWGWYYLPADTTLGLPEMIIDLRRLHTVPLDLLRTLSKNDKRRARLQVPYREHLAKHFADTFSRIGLPQPYETM